MQTLLASQGKIPPTATIVWFPVLGKTSVEHNQPTDQPTIQTNQPPFKKNIWF